MALRGSSVDEIANNFYRNFSDFGSARVDGGDWGGVIGTFFYIVKADDADV